VTNLFAVCTIARAASDQGLRISVDAKSHHAAEVDVPEMGWRDSSQRVVLDVHVTAVQLLHYVSTRSGRS
jgi:hypothetical protein